jgi:CHAT domain-containing protein/Tfp pilus assembly protein PilF
MASVLVLINGRRVRTARGSVATLQAAAMVLALLCAQEGIGWGQAASLEDAQRLRAQAAEFARQAQYKEAAGAAEQAVAIDEKLRGPDAVDTAASLHALAEARAGMGDYGKAVTAAQRALGMRERQLGPEHPDTAQSLNDLGVIYLKMGDDLQAVGLIKRALEIRKRLQPPALEALAESHHNLAEVYRRAKKYAEALDQLQESLRTKEAAFGPNDARVASAHNALAAVYAEMSRAAADDTRREEYQLKAAEHAVRAKARSSDQRPEAASVLINRAWSLWGSDPITSDQVHDLFQQALAIREQTLGPDHPDTAQSLVLLAIFFEKAGDYRKALSLFERALAAEDRTLASALGVGNEEQRLAFVARAQGHYWAALSLIHRHFPNDPAAVRFGMDQVLRRKGIILDAEVRTRETIARHLQGGALASWRRLTQHREELSKLLLSGPGGQGAAEYKRAIERLQAAIQREEEFLGPRSPLVAQDLAERQVTAHALAGRLPPDAVLVEFVRIRDWDGANLGWSQTSRYLAFVLTPDDQLTLVDLGDAGAIDAGIDRALTAINDPRAFDDPVAYSQNTNARLADLYGSLLAPLEARIDARQRLIVSPDGEINRAPFSALRTPTGRYLVEDRLVSHVTSGRDLLRAKTGVAPTVTLLLVANPAFDDKEALRSTRPRQGRAVRPAGFRRSFGSLPGTAEEAEAIKPLVAGTKKVLLGADATEAAVRETSRPHILHFATHGFFMPLADEPAPDPLDRPGRGASRDEEADPLRHSALALAGANYAYTMANDDDGLLWAKEVGEMDLYGTDLVVLSACQTALGEVEVGEGVYGLRRAFVLAGARNLVMSLWEVDDDVTRDLMERFYRAYRGGVRPAEALRRAQIETIASLREKSKAGADGQPVAMVNLWAPFIMQQTGE